MENSCPILPESKVLYKQHEAMPKPLDSKRCKTTGSIDFSTPRTWKLLRLLCCEPPGQQTAVSKSKCCHHSSRLGAQRWGLIEPAKAKHIKNFIKIHQCVRYPFAFNTKNKQRSHCHQMTKACWA